MKKVFLFATAAALLVGCSSNELLDSPTGDLAGKGEIPIEFNVQKQNITRAANLESVKHYNFGVWAWKVDAKAEGSVTADQEIMNNYLVGYSSETNKIGYKHDGATTWAAVPGTTSDHTSPWFYEKLGNTEYAHATNGAGENYYTTSDADYLSNNANQYLRYWDLAYAKTNFYCYAPYNKNVTFSHVADGTSTMTFPATGAIRDGYDEPLNSAYNAYSRTLGEFMYAGVQATNASRADVTVPFKHMGAQLFIRFYEDIPGYKVEIIDLDADKASDPTTDIMKGIQATPAVVGAPTYANGTYYTTSGATVTFTENDAVATYTPGWTGSTTATNTTPLMFKIPTEGLSTAAVAPANLTNYAGLNSTTHKIIKEANLGGTQEYSYSPTVYYPVAQPTTSTTCFTFHVSYRIIAEDNKEVTTIHNATVHVPYSGVVKTGAAGASEAESTTDGTTSITVWQPNVKYTYTFKITRGSTGTTDPATTIDPTNPTPSTTKSLYPIVFDAATIEDYTTNYSTYEVSNGTAY